VNDVNEQSEPRRSRIAPVIAVAVAVVFAGLFYVFAVAGGDEADSADTPLLGRPAPDVSGELADGSEFTLGQQRGDWVVLNFFDADCVPCRREHPELIKFDEAQDAKGPDGAELVTVVWGLDHAAATEFLADHGSDWPIVYDDGSISTAFAVVKVPETWIIDPNGFVVRRFIAEVTAEQLNTIIAVGQSGGVSG